MTLRAFRWGGIALVAAVLVSGCSFSSVHSSAQTGDEQDVVQMPNTPSLAPSPVTPDRPVNQPQTEEPAGPPQGQPQQAPVEEEVAPDALQGMLPEFLQEPSLPLLVYHGDSQWGALDRTVRDVAADYPGRISVVAVDLLTNERYEFRPKDVYYPASTFKLPVALCVLQAIERGELTWDTPITYTEDDYDDVGGGAFYETTFGTKWPVHNLVRRSLVSSNNIAVRMLSRTLGWDNLLRCTTAIGGTVTRTDTGSSPVTIEAEVAWWQYLWKLRGSNSKLADGVIQPLRESDYRGRIMSGTPRSDLVLQKFGSYATNEHAGAIVLGDRPYILVVMTHGAGEYTADVAIEQIAQAAWQTAAERK